MAVEVLLCLCVITQNCEHNDYSECITAQHVKRFSRHSEFNKHQVIN